MNESQNIIHTFGWKGVDQIQIQTDNTGYYVVEHRKNKTTGEVKTQTKHVTNEAYNTLKKIVMALDTNTVYGYRYLVNKLLEHYQFHTQNNLTQAQMVEAWNGGKNRSKYYFPYHYYPIKILEAQGIITYYGNGSVQRRERG